MDEDIVINVEFEGEDLSVPNAGNVQVVPANVAWEDFELMMKVFSDQEDIEVRYVDDERDIVTICSEEELKEAFKVARQCNNTLNIRVQCHKPGSRDQEREKMRQEKAQESQPPAPPAVPIPVVKAEKKDPEPQTEGAKAKPPKPEKKATFFLKNQSTGLVMDLQGWKNTAGSPVIAWEQKNAKKESVLNQLWYTDSTTGTIRNAWNNMCLTAEPKDKGQQAVTVYPYDSVSISRQMWCINGGVLEHSLDPSWVLGQNGRQIVAATNTGSILQRWIVHPFDYEASEKKRISVHKKRPMKAPKHYVELAREFAKAESSPVPDSSEAPQWFTKEMNKMKSDMASEVSARVAQLTVRQVLQGLEGAVVSSLSVPATAAPTPQQTRTHSMESRVRYSHDGIICDHCDCSIVGVRYKCGNCEDYDLCEECEALEGVHDDSHVFLALRRPVVHAGRRSDGRMEPLLRHNIYNRAAKPPKPEKLNRASSSDEPTSSASDVRNSKIIERLRRKEEKLKKKEEKLKKKEEKIEEKRKKTEEKMKRRLDGEERPSKKERLDLPQFKTTMRMNAVFLADESFPDGSHVQPGTKIVKKWRVQNDGTHDWDDNTRLEMVWGSMVPVHTEVNVPHLKVQEVGTVSAEIMAPSEPGTYQSHWRLVHAGKRFGHRIWCSILVDPAEILEVPTATPEVIEVKPEVTEVAEKVKVVVQGQTDEDLKAEITKDEAGELVKVKVTVQQQQQQQQEVVSMAPVQLPAPSEPVVTGSESEEMLAAQYILSYEMLNINDGNRQAPRKSQTATPNNTPLESRDVTPPKSPVPEEMEKVEEEEEEEEDSSSSVEVVGETPGSEEPVHSLTQYVQDKMASLGFGPDADVESLSSFSESSCDSDDTDKDYYIVPIPDCFNPDLPASMHASTSVYVPKKGHGKTIDEILTASSSLSTPPLLPSNVSQCSKDIQVTPSMSSMDSQASVPMVTTQNQASVDMVPAENQTRIVMVTAHSQATPVTMTIDCQTPPRALSTADVVSQTANWVKMVTADSQTPVTITADSQTATVGTVVSTAQSQTTVMTTNVDSQTAVTTTSNVDSQTAVTATNTVDSQTAATSTNSVDIQTVRTNSVVVDGQTNTDATSTCSVVSQTSAAMSDAQLQVTRETSDAQLQVSPQEVIQKPVEEEEDDEEEHRFEDAQGDLSEEENDTTEDKTPLLTQEPQDEVDGQARSGASSDLVSAAMSVASQAFSAAKDVFHTLQYVPPQSTWTPKQEKWTPPSQPQWTPPEEAEWTPPTADDGVPKQRNERDSEEMAQLLEMGFANRQLNRSLLEKHDNDLEQVIAELIRSDDGWPANRH